MTIPQQLQNPEFRFCLLKPKSKVPFEKDWANKGYKFDTEKLNKHIADGGNYGVIGGYGGLIILDKDKPELPIDFETFTIQTGSGGKHYYILSDYNQNHVFVNQMGELRANNYQVVGAGSIHPNGNTYKVIKDLPLKYISSEELKYIIEPYIRGEEPIIEQGIEPTNKDTSRSGLEYRKILALQREGKTREEIYKIMEAYSKWKDSSEQYRALTFEKAENFYLQEQETKNTKKHIPTEEELNFLKNPEFFNLIIKEENKKIEGEQKSKKAITLSLCSVWVMGSEVPLDTLVSSESSAGKSFICKNIIKLFPKETVVYRTKITPEAFTYWKNQEDWNWDGKICYLEDVSQGILDSPTFKVMCSEGSIATIVIKQKAVDIEIQGKPVMLLTTSRTNPNTEILNRFQIVPLDESKEQTRAIVFRQARQKGSEDYNLNITNALRLLKRKYVIIPYAEKIAECLSKDYNFENIRLRRDFSRLLDLIKCSAVLHQFQRKEIDSKTIEANEQDYFIAREVINYIQTQTFKGLTHKLKKAFDCCSELQEFTANEIHSKFPFVNQKSWYGYLDDLLERKMLNTETRNIEGEKQDGKRFVTKTTYYMVNVGTVFELPEFNNLPQNITNVTIHTNDTNDTNDTNGSQKIGNDCNDCNDCYGKPYTKTPIIHSYDESWEEEQLMKGQKRLPDVKVVVPNFEEKQLKESEIDPKPKNRTLKFFRRST